jgi:hypothetical protein
LKIAAVRREEREITQTCRLRVNLDVFSGLLDGFGPVTQLAVTRRQVIVPDVVARISGYELVILLNALLPIPVVEVIEAA